jgi:hypothetical protein
VNHLGDWEILDEADFPIKTMVLIEILPGVLIKILPGVLIKILS